MTIIYFIVFKSNYEEYYFLLFSWIIQAFDDNTNIFIVFKSKYEEYNFYCLFEQYRFLMIIIFFILFISNYVDYIMKDNNEMIEF